MFQGKAPGKKNKAKNSYRSPRHFLIIKPTTMADALRSNTTYRIKGAKIH